MAEDKKVRLGFQVDPKGLQDARNAIRALTSDVKQLVDTLSKVSVGGMLGGISSKSGPINTRQEAIKLPGVNSTLASSISKDAQALAQVSRAGVQAMDGLTRSLKSNFSGQIQDIERLKRELASLEKAYDKIKTYGGPGSSPRMQQAASSAMIAKELQIRGVQAQLAGHYAAREAGPGAEHFERARMWASGAMNADRMPPAGGGSPLMAGGGGFLRGAAQGLGFGGLGAMMSSPAAIGAAAAAIAIKAIDLNAARTTSNAADRLNRGMEPGRLGARIGSSLGGLGMSIRGGDLASSVAYDRMRVQMATRGMDFTNFDRNRLALDEAGFTGTAAVTGAMGDMLASGANAVVGNKRSAGDKDSRYLEYWRRRRETPAAIAEEQAEMVRNEVASRAKESFFLNQTYGDAFGNISMARMGGLGLGLIKDKNGNPIDTKLGRFKAAAERQGYSAGEWASARAQLGGIAGRGLMGYGPTMLSAQLGGFGSAGNVIGAGAQFGPAMGLFNTAQLGMGRGGVDATAGSQIAAMVASMMTSGNFAGADGSAALMGLMSAGRTGSAGGDMRAARMLQGGVGEFGRNLTGQTDRLQEGINMLAANSSGARGWYAKKALMTMDPMQMLNIMRSGEMPGYLSDQGITSGMVGNYNAFRNQHAFSRFMDQEGGGSEMGRSVAGVKSAGGVGAYIHSLVDGVKDPKQRRAIIDRELGRLGRARQLTEGGNLENNTGALLAELSTDKGLFKDLKGTGAWAAGIKGTTEGAVAQNTAKSSEEFSKWQATHYDSLKDAIGRMDMNQKELADITSNLVGDSKNLETAIQLATGAFMDLLTTVAPLKAEALAKEHKVLADHLRKKAVPHATTGKGMPSGIGANGLPVAR